MAVPVTLVDAGGLPITQVANGVTMTPTTNAYPVTLVNSGGIPVSLVNNDGSAYSVGPSAPVNTIAPQITSNSGNTWEGSTLTVLKGTWTGSPTPTYAYQWNRAGTPISGATGTTYVLTSSDTGNAITCTVTATNSQGNDSATSGSVSAVLPPLITATPTGSTLFVSEGDSIVAGYQVTSSFTALFAGTDTTDITFSNQAQGGSVLSNVVGRGTTVDNLISANPGKSSYVLLTAFGAAETQLTTYYPSDAAGFIAGYAAYLDARKLAGYKRVACTIVPYQNNSSWDAWIQTVNAGIRQFVTQGHAEAVIDLYNAPVMGGFGTTQNTTLYQDGIHPTQTGDRYLERAIATTLSGVMHADLPAISSVSITGTAMQGQTANAVVSGVTGHPAPTIAYAWFRNSTQVATGQTYVYQAADVGQSMTVTAQPTNAAGTGSAVMSGSVTPAALPAPVNSVVPTITGSATQGTTLAGGDGTWTNSPTSYTRQWYRDNSATPISGATGANYTLTGTDVGHTIIYGVIATNAGDSSTQSYSLATATVIASNNQLLDTLSASPSAAYSTRKLKGSYAGSAIKVRRSSDNTTQDIGFDENGDLDTAALATFVGSGSGFIDTWYDQSGNGYHVTQTTTAAQPRIRNAGTTDTLNSKPAVRFLGGACRLASATGFPQTTHSMAVLLGPTTSSGFAGIVGGGGAAANAHMLLLYGGSSPQPVGFYNNNSPGALEASATGFVSLGTQASYIAVYDRSSSPNYQETIYRAGSPRVQSFGTPNAYTATEIMLGNLDGTSNFAYIGAIPEVLIFPTILSAGDIKKIDVSHNLYWGSAASAGEIADADAGLPAQTGNTAPSGYNVVASGQYDNSGNYDKWHVFDKNYRTYWAAQAGTTGWVGRQTPSALTLTGYAVVQGTGGGFFAPKDWTFEGSNDGSSWTVLDTRSNQTGLLAGERTVYTIPSGARGSYTYHRLNITGSNSGSFVAFSELEFLT